MKWIARGLTLGTALWASLSPHAARAAQVDFARSILNGSAVIDRSGPGVLAFDVELANASFVALEIDFDPGESSVVWNALVGDLYGLLIDRYPVAWFAAATDWAVSAPPGGGSAVVVLPESHPALLRWVGIAAVAGLAALRAARRAKSPTPGSIR